jgi:antitoxin component of MazEF toxin-antitoxin module
VIQKIERVGDRYAITISQTVFDMLGIPEGADVELRAAPGQLTIRPVDRESHAAHVRESARRMLAIHREAFEKLAE